MDKEMIMVLAYSAFRVWLKKPCSGRECALNCGPHCPNVHPVIKKASREEREIDWRQESEPSACRHGRCPALLHGTVSEAWLYGIRRALMSVLFVAWSCEQEENESCRHDGQSYMQHGKALRGNAKSLIFIGGRAFVKMISRLDVALM